MEPLWIDNPSVLIKTMRIFPDNTMSKNEKYNSICRFIMISNVFVSVHRRIYKNLIAGILFCYLICLYAKKYDFNESDVQETNDKQTMNNKPSKNEKSNDIPEETLDVDFFDKQSDPRDNFAHSVYGEINNNRKMMVYNNRYV